MSSKPASCSASLSPNDPVEIVQSAHGNKKAKYAGRTFMLQSKNGLRHRWRCDLHHCRSRLSTDVYGDQHLVYAYQPHNVEVHRLAEEGRKRRSEGGDKQQPRRVIESFRYVLEKRDGGLQTWHCEFTTCPARCRTTYDGLMVAAPSMHSEDAHVQMGQPFTAKQHQETCSTMSQQLQQPEHQHDSGGGPVQVQDKIAADLQSPSSSLSTAATDFGDVTASRGGRKSHRLAARHALLTGEQGTGATSSGPFSSGCDGNSQPSLAQNSNESAVTVDKAGHSDVVSPKHEDTDNARNKSDNENLDIEFDTMDTANEITNPIINSSGNHASDIEEQRLPSNCVYGGTSAEEAGERLPYKSAVSLFHDQDFGYSRSLHARCEQVLQMMRGNGYNREGDLRTNILVQMQRLLEAETSLVDQKRRVETVRERLLEQKLQNIVP